MDNTETTNGKNAPFASTGLLCDQCRDTGEKVVFDDRFADGYAIVFCGCIHGKTLSAVQSDTLSDHGA